MKIALNEPSIIVAVLAALMLGSTIATTYYDVDCFIRFGPSATLSTPSFLNCTDADYTMVSCGFHSNTNVLGSYIKNDVCYAELDASANVNGTDYGHAIARCCALPTGSSCSSVSTRETSADSLTVGCSSASSTSTSTSTSADNVLVGCSINEDSGSIDQQFEGVYAGDTYSTDSLNVQGSSAISKCTGSSFDVSSNPFTIGTRCCSTPADYQMECYSVWSSTSQGYTDACDTVLTLLSIEYISTFLSLSLFVLFCFCFCLGFLCTHTQNKLKIQIKDRKKRTPRTNPKEVNAALELTSKYKDEIARLQEFSSNSRKMAVILDRKSVV
jgi:hypothetical protein